MVLYRKSKVEVMDTVVTVSNRNERMAELHHRKLNFSTWSMTEQDVKLQNQPEYLNQKFDP